MGISPWSDVVMDTELENGVSGSWNILEEVQKVIQDTLNIKNPITLDSQQ